MRSKTLFAATAALTFAAGSTQADILYSHAFDGSATSIDGAAVDTAVSGNVLGADHGTSSTAWDSNDTTALQNGTTDANDLVVLSFSPVDGYVYTVTVTGTHSGWLGGGFVNSATPGVRLNSDGIAWGLTRPGSGNTNGEQVAHFNAAGGTGNVGSTTDSTSPSTISVVLDTTGGAGSWDAQYFVNGVLFHTESDLGLTAEGNIAGVGYGSNGDGSDIQSFSLTVVPEPGSLALMALGGLCVLRRRRS